MKHKGNLRKMKTTFSSPVEYEMVFYDQLEQKETVPINKLIGKEIRLSFDGNIHCVVTGKKIKKAFGEGMSYEAFMNAPQAAESIIHPELSTAHLGIPLRDLDWEIEHHVKPHYTYLSLTSGAKVGVTRVPQKLTRWMDQGAVQGLVLAKTPYRQAAGLIEVALKEHMSDKTNWRNMLKNVVEEGVDLKAMKEEVANLLPEDLKDFILKDEEIVEFEYPVEAYPEKVTSLKLDKAPVIETKLRGIKGQYLILDEGKVINIRSHSGYEVELEY